MQRTREEKSREEETKTNDHKRTYTRRENRSSTVPHCDSVGTVLNSSCFVLDRSLDTNEPLLRDKVWTAKNFRYGNCSGHFETLASSQSSGIPSRSTLLLFRQVDSVFLLQFSLWYGKREGGYTYWFTRNKGQGPRAVSLLHTSRLTLQCTVPHGPIHTHTRCKLV
jgi:hypothetical protein